MAFDLGPADGDDEDQVVSTINTTPLVDVMLVLLIIFLITIPVVTQTVPVKLPSETNVARQTRPDTIDLSVNRDGDVFWNRQFVAGNAVLVERLKRTAVQVPQPEVHIRGDQETRYGAIGRVVYACQRAGIARISFVTEPPPKG